MGAADVEFVPRLLLATGCGLLIGLERQYRSRTAGLRTHALVAAGASVSWQSLDADPRGDDDRDDDDNRRAGRSSGTRRWDPWRMIGH